MLSWITQTNNEVTEWLNLYLFPIVTALAFVGCLIGMTPLTTNDEQKFHQILFVYARKIILISFMALGLTLGLTFLIYTTMSVHKAVSTQVFQNWIFALFKRNYFPLLLSITMAYLIRFFVFRYWLTAISSIFKKLRKTQFQEQHRNIKKDLKRYQAKDFLPEKYYSSDAMFIGINEYHQPIQVPNKTWYETNMQVIGPTRYGKGIVLGCIMDQAIRRGDCLFYIDPKSDQYAPHIMYQACLDVGRKFYYLTLHDNGIGKWAPFVGGDSRDGLSRLEIAFGLEYSGESGTDYYKSIERTLLVEAFSKTRSLKGLQHELDGSEASRIQSELSQWVNVKSLCPPSKKGFSIAQAIKENAVVYVQGSLDDSTVKTATKIFMIELIQEAKRMHQERHTHLTAIIDEVSFIISKNLAQTLATSIGFQTHFILAYQSPSDLLNAEDKTIHTKYLHQSINVNTQLKLIYGGADYDTAEWVAKLSGMTAKKVTRLERTEVNPSGGEVWEKGRTIGIQEEPHIHPNVVLTLPPRVCVFIQPGCLASICFSSFVPVRNRQTLNIYLKQREKSAQHKGVEFEDKPMMKIESENILEDLKSIDNYPVDTVKKTQQQGKQNDKATKKINTKPELRQSPTPQREWDDVERITSDPKHTENTKIESFTVDALDTSDILGE